MGNETRVPTEARQQYGRQFVNTIEAFESSVQSFKTKLAELSTSKSDRPGPPGAQYHEDFSKHLKQGSDIQGKSRIKILDMLDSLPEDVQPEASAICADGQHLINALKQEYDQSLETMMGFQIRPGGQGRTPEDVAAKFKERCTSASERIKRAFQLDEQ